MEDYLKAKGYSLQKEKLQYAGHTCDIIAKKGKEKLCIVVEVDNNFKDKKTKWEALSGNREWNFCLFIKESNFEKIKQLLEEWSIYYKTTYTYKNGS